MSPSDAKNFDATSGSDLPSLVTISFAEDPKASLGAQVRTGCTAYYTLPNYSMYDTRAIVGWSVGQLFACFDFFA